jgi:hypothetical protein
MSAAIGDNDPLTLDEAARVLLRGTVGAATLYAAARRRELTTERLGRRIVTTPAAVREWRRKCRAQAEAPTSTSNSEGTAARFGTSGMESVESQRAAARVTLSALAPPSKGTSRGRPNRNSGTVIRIASGSQP